jgi:transposase-like protein
MGVPGKRLDEATRARIREEIERDKLSIRNVARRHGVSRNTVRKYGRKRG